MDKRQIAKRTHFPVVFALVVQHGQRIAFLKFPDYFFIYVKHGYPSFLLSHLLCFVEI